MPEEAVSSEAHRLETLWESDFGDAYLERNLETGTARGGFWRNFVARYPAESVLEVGCGHGANLMHLSALLPPRVLWGVDINEASLAQVPATAPGTNTGWSVARSLPFRDRWFDLVFTVAVLIHQPDDVLPIVMSEIVRTSRRWVLCAEYFADERTEVDWRGTQGALIKRDYSRIYQQVFPELKLLERGELTAEQGFDRVSYAVLERP